MRFAHSIFAVIAGLGACDALAQAAGADEPARLRLNGFGTLGVVHTQAPEGWGHRRAHDQPRRSVAWRADVDSRLGLQANYQLTSEVEAVGQLLLHRQVRSDPVQLAFLAWRPRPGLTVRLGRTNNDVFMYSESRHVGFSYPWARPNHETNAPLPVYSLNGVDATWRWERAQAFWSVHAYLGRGDSHVAGAQPGTALRYQVENLAGVTLERQHEGLQLRATVAAVRGQMARSEATAQSLALLQRIGALPLAPGSATAHEATLIHDRLAAATSPRRITYLSVGAAHDDGGPWIAAMEAIAALSDRPVGEGRMAFASVGRRFGPVTAYVGAGAGRFSHAWQPHADWRAELQPLVGPQNAALAAQVMRRLDRELMGGAVRQRSVTLGARWDVHPRAALKLQLDRYSVDAGGSLFWTTGEPRSAHPLVGSLSLDFVF